MIRHQEEQDLEGSFYRLSDRLINALHNHEYLTISLDSERSQFTRFNHAKVRQSGVVADGNVTISLLCDQREAYATFPFTGNDGADIANAMDSLNYLRHEVSQIPENPYAVIPENRGSSRELYQGELLSADAAIATILEPVGSADFTGFYAAGSIIRANVTSVGQRHWFATDSFFVDYSMFVQTDSGEKAVKGIYAGKEWRSQDYQAQIQHSQQQLVALQKPSRTITKGQYRTYFAPVAASELLGFLTWSVGEASLQQGSSALLKLRNQERTLSPLLSLSENFSAGNVPKFNSLGEVAPEYLPIISNGQLVNTLVSSRSAKEYQKEANGASTGESMRSPEFGAGSLKNDDILQQLDTGLYLSNLHYLNWSDRSGGRITGMTRYACFWVENGELVAPIDNLRFDDSIYDFLGANLIDLTEFREFVPDTGTYSKRSLGGILNPGMLIDRFTFTL
ncbi:TldD/PmbA family protein [Pseudanabaena sp. FACHB-1277]|jgi:predicted Zn-dependent protease|uniref:TldD/PmbA family protein n=1 Tax=Pseudanabaena cinerea FACHB-1277 TaxID=2949581 RepID=A0A926UVA7_9CYAN|nr:metallopeptidase TldD-related protein [Pseudanabaena cinerea]MBD2151854.1 TldD/PmbA family protein [Pseudanabaena cinerea FACHB-1277]